MRSLSALAPDFHPAVQPMIQPKPSIITHAPNAAQQAVLSTVELIEHVFEYLTPKELLTTSRACTLFHTIIKTSPTIQQALFQRPNPKTTAITWTWIGPPFVPHQDILTYIKVDEDNDPRQCGATRIHYLNPLLLHLNHSSAFDLPIRCWAGPPSDGTARFHRKIQLFSGNGSHYSLEMDIRISMGDRINSLSKGATCLSMQLADPPVRKVVVVLIRGFSSFVGHCGTGMRTQRGRGRRMRKVSTSRHTIEKEFGVLFGDVADLVKHEYLISGTAYSDCLKGSVSLGHIEFPDSFAITQEERQVLELRRERDNKIKRFKEEMAVIARTRP